MKVLWVINIILPAIAKELGLIPSVREGWLSGTFDNWDTTEDIKLYVAYPVAPGTEKKKITVKGIECFPFEEDLLAPEKYDASLEDELKAIISQVSPDVLHIFGTEFPHAYAAAKVFNDAEHTLVGMQGVCYRIAEDYMSELPNKLCGSATFRDIVKRDSLRAQKNKFIKRGEVEKKLLSITGHVTGRTEFDKESVLSINSDIHYHHMNETMRQSFYSDAWDMAKIERHSIFIGQGDYPIKGLHFLIEAAGKLSEKYSDIKIYIAGNSIMNKNLIKIPAYGKYLKKVANKYGIYDRICSTGALNEQGMKERYLKSAAFVCASYVENSPNTLAEAMLLGMPVITSDAGGITSMISDNEGYIFKRGDVEALCEYLDEVFRLEDECDSTLLDRCMAARKRAMADYNGETNHIRLLNIYRKIV